MNDDIALLRKTEDFYSKLGQLSTRLKVRMSWYTYEPYQPRILNHAAVIHSVLEDLIIHLY